MIEYRLLDILLHEPILCGMSKRAKTQAHLQPSTPLTRMWWRAKVVRVENGYISQGPKWRRYDVGAAYDKARTKRDPLLSPHGHFFALQPGSERHAREFLETFGQLGHFGVSAGRTPHGVLKTYLPSFWVRQLRYRLVVQLWENRNYPMALMHTMQEISERYAEASDALDEIPLGFSDASAPAHVTLATEMSDAAREAIIGTHGQAVSGRIPPFPWNLENTSFNEWIRRTPPPQMRSWAIELVRQELDIHSRKSWIAWEIVKDHTGERLRPTSLSDSLLSMIWELFGRETAELEWRRCPHCQMLFYPKRKDQFYCNPRQQALASKRAYANRRRKAEQEVGAGSKE